jgi:hypothetical protein
MQLPSHERGQGKRWNGHLVSCNLQRACLALRIRRRIQIDFKTGSSLFSVGSCKPIDR